MTIKIKTISATALLGVIAVTAGCGSSGSPGKPAASDLTNRQQAAVAAAIAETKKYEAAQPPVTVGQISGTIPRNVRLGVLNCTFPVCVASVDAALAAAKSKLGWTVSQVSIQTTPQQYVSGWNQLLQLHPDAVIYAGAFPSKFVSSQLAQLAKDRVPTVVLSPNGTPESIGSKYAVAGAPQLAMSGHLMGDVMVASAGRGPNVVFVTAPALASTLQPVQSALSQVVKAAGGSVGVLQINLDDVGKAVPGQVVNYLQSHPNTQYVAFALSDFDAGVPQALAAAGLAKKVKIVSRAPEASNLADIKNGTEFASVGEEVEANGFRALEDLILLKMGLTPPDPNPVGWHQIFVQGNVTQTSQVPPTPGVPAAFYSAWHLTS
jgi:ribose transport system substrate-binding protein